MNKKKLSILLLITAVILLFSSCGDMMVESDDISIDLSSVVSRDLTDQYAKISLVALGRNSFLELAADEALQPIINATVSLSNIPVGPVYTIYLSVGTYNETTKVFKVAKAFNGNVSVTGGATTATSLKVSAIKTTPIGDTTGKALKGAAFAVDKIYSIYDGDLINATDGTSVPPAPDFTFNSVTAGYNNKLIISMTNKDGEGFAKATGVGSVDYSYADLLPAEIEGTDKNINVISADAFWDDTEQLEMVIGQTDGGLIFHIKDVDDGSDEWMVLDLGPYLAEAGLDLKGKMINSISVIKKYSGADVSELWIYMASQVGDFRIMMPVDGTGFELTPVGDETETDAIMNLFVPFKTGNALEGRKILGITTTSGDTLYIGTDMGLYKATASAEIANMAPTVIAASGKRVEMLKGGDNYTACVTALQLIIIRNSDNATATINFNEGLPVSGLLSGGAITGMAWNGNVLYVAGNYGLVSVNAADLF